MSALTDLQTSVARVGTDVTNEAAAVRGVATQLANIAPDDSAALEAMTTQLNASADTLEASAASLTTPAAPAAPATPDQQTAS